MKYEEVKQMLEETRELYKLIIEEGERIDEQLAKLEDAKENIDKAANAYETVVNTSNIMEMRQSELQTLLTEYKMKKAA